MISCNGFRTACVGMLVEHTLPNFRVPQHEVEHRAQFLQVIRFEQ